jgi:hypothetical protein
LGLQAVVLVLVLVVFFAPVVCAQHHLSHNGRSPASSPCASALALALSLAGLPLALVLVNLLAPFVDYLYLPPVYLPIFKPPQ